MLHRRQVKEEISFVPKLQFAHASNEPEMRYQMLGQHAWVIFAGFTQQNLSIQFATDGLVIIGEGHSGIIPDLRWVINPAP